MATAGRKSGFVFPILLSVVLDGTLVPNTAFDALTDSASAAAFFQLTVNGDTGPFVQYDFQTNGCPPGGITGPPPFAQSCVNTTTIHTQVSVPFVISDPLRDFEISAFLGSTPWCQDTFSKVASNVSFT